MQYQSYDFENDSYQDTLYENEDSIMEGFYATPDSSSSGGNSCNKRSVRQKQGKRKQERKWWVVQEISALCLQRVFYSLP